MCNRNNPSALLSRFIREQKCILQRLAILLMGNLHHYLLMVQDFWVPHDDCCEFIPICQYPAGKGDIMAKFVWAYMTCNGRQKEQIEQTGQLPLCSRILKQTNQPIQPSPLNPNYMCILWCQDRSFA